MCICNNNFTTGSLKVKVRRDHLVEDAYEELHTAESKLKGQIKVNIFLNV